VFVAEPDHERYGERVAYRTEWIDASGMDSERRLLVGRPAEVLPPNAEHVAIVLDTVGQSEQSREVRVALGLSKPQNDDEAHLAAYHAPTRALLEEQGVDFERIVRVWDFTTRSAGDATFRLHAMMDELDANLGGMSVEIDTLVVPANPDIAGIVRGRLLNAPSFADDDGYLVLDEEGRPQVVGTRSIEFRVMLPAGEGEFPLVLYGHGTGGSVNDPLFDEELAAQGIAKLSIQFDGWTDKDFVQTLLGFSTFLEGSERSTAGLMEALAGGTALLTSMDGGVLGQALAADTLAGEPNAAAGRGVDFDRIAWAGGSMGGTMGGVMTSADPRLRIGVLNVPGAGWTHMVPYSLLYAAGMGSVLSETYPDPADQHLAMIMGQGSWDEVDGAPWADEALAAGGVFLLQESMEDPILPNLGTELLANAFGAVQINPVLQPIHGLDAVDGPVTSGAAMTQFHVPDTGQYDVHGFAAKETPAGDAAREQILEFLVSAWAGSPVMQHPGGCVEATDDGTCDFMGMWE
jgi:hypothetical protein